MIRTDALLGERTPSIIDAHRRPDDVLELLAIHATLRQISQRVRASSTPANGET